jgi:hypothetical protein
MAQNACSGARMCFLGFVAPKPFLGKLGTEKPLNLTLTQELSIIDENFIIRKRFDVDIWYAARRRKYSFASSIGMATNFCR